MSFCRRGKSAWNQTDKICDRKARNLRIPSRQKKEKQYITKETKNSSGIKIKIKKRRKTVRRTREERQGEKENRRPPRHRENKSVRRKPEVYTDMKAK